MKSEPASGSAQQWSYTSDLDGKDTPITGSNPNADMVAVKRIDAHTLESVNKKGGKVTTTQRNVVAADGKTRTVTTTGTDGQGQKVNNVAGGPISSKCAAHHRKNPRPVADCDPSPLPSAHIRGRVSRVRR